MRRVAILFGLLVAGLALSILVLASDDSGEFDRTDPQAVFRAAMEAVHDGDWRTLRSILTKEARSEMERDLARLKRRLSHPDDGKSERSLASQRLGDRAAAEIQRVVDGGPPEALRFYVLIMPRERSPQPRGMQAKTFERTFLYASTDGTLRPVRLVQVDGEWLVADLQL